MKLTIGLPVYDDFNGAYFTIQALRTYHREELQDCEILVIDNHPDSPEGKTLQGLVERMGKDANPAVRYIPYTDVFGPANAKDRVFREARGDMVLCMDSHVLLEPGAIAALLQWAEDNPDSQDILSGPMFYDDLVGYATHFDDVWRGEMWGIWARDDRGGDPSNEPFEVPAMGCGLFAARRESWLGFNPAFRGFGGEEFYIHTKYRQAGRKALCLPALRWIHRFGRPGGVPYPLLRFYKVRNYVIGHQELGLPLDRVHEHFVQGNLMSQQEWDWLLEDPIFRIESMSAAAKSGGCVSCGGGIAQGASLEEAFEHFRNANGDISEHLPTLKEFSSKCGVVVEFAHRPIESTAALLAGQPEQFITYTDQPNAFHKTAMPLAGKTQFLVHSGNSLNMDIPECDLLFIDTRHTADHLWKELERHASKVRRFIILHDTVTFGNDGEGGGPGLMHAVRRWVKENPEWTVIRHDRNNNGLLIMSKDEKDKKKVPGLARKVMNFAKHASEHVADGLKTVDEDVYEQRFDLCAVCSSRNGEDCGECGCPIAKKASWRTSYCDLGKWGAVQ